MFRKILILVFFYEILNIYSPDDGSPQVEGMKPSETTYPILPLTIVKGLLGKYTEPRSIQNKGPNNRVQFSSSNFLPSQEQFLCPIEDNHRMEEIRNTNNIEIEDLESGLARSQIPEHCLFVKNFPSNETPKCIHEATPVIQKLTTDDGLNGISCGGGGVGQLYRFQYNLCLERNWQQEIIDKGISELSKLFGINSEKRPKIEVLPFVIYKFCYDHLRKLTIYTEHEILAPELLDSNELKKEKEITFDMDANGFTYFRNDFEVVKNKFVEKNIFNTFEPPRAPLEDEQTPPTDGSNEFLPHQLVPADDMVFALWRKPTFHLANIKLLPTKFVSDWNRIGTLMREVFKEDSIKYRYKVYTRVYPPGLGDEQETQMWVKMMRELQTNKQSAIVMSYKADNEVLQKYCPEDSCGEVRAELEYGNHFRCCPTTDAIRELFGILPES